jgi:O-antigen ligase
VRRVFEVESESEDLLTAAARIPRLLPPLRRPGRDAAAAAGAALLVVPLGAASIYSARLILAAAAGVLLVYVTFRWLLAGAVLFVIVTFPAQLPGSIGVGATIAKPFGLVLACSWLLTLIREPRRPLLFRDRPVLGAFLVAYLGWAMVSVLWSASAGDTAQALKRLMLSIVWMVVLFSVAGTRRAFITLMSGFVAASALTSIYVLASGVVIAGGRATGGVSDPNYLASELVLATIAGGYLLGATRRRSARLLLLGALGVDLVVFLFTQSRGGLIGMAVGVVAALVVAGRTRAVVFAVTAVFLAAGVGYFGIVAPAQVRHRVTDFSTNASSGRRDSWQIAWKIAKAHPITGVAPGGYRNEQLKYAASSIDVQHVTYILDDRLVVHNTYLETLAELGLVGFVLLGGTVLICLRSAWRAIALAEVAGDQALANVLRGLVAGSCGLLAAYVFVSAEYEKQLWFALALLAVSKPLVGRIADEEVAELDPAPATGRGLRPAADASAAR